MQQLSKPRTYSISDFFDWYQRGEIELQPKFQRRSVWTGDAQSYLIDTITRGKPIPKIYMRQYINPKTKRVYREVVDGQQRLRAIFSFLQDDFKVKRSHNKDMAGKHFSELSEDIQNNIRQYDLSTDVLYDMSDTDVMDIFCRLNTYAVVLNAQELRHANFLGEFRSSIYQKSNAYYKFWTKYRVFSDKNILRMQEAEFVSELYITMIDGIRSKNKKTIDSYYKKYDESFEGKTKYEKRFNAIMKAIVDIFGDSLLYSRLRSRVLLYPLFCTLFHMKYGLNGFAPVVQKMTEKRYRRIRESMAYIDVLAEKIDEEIDKAISQGVGEEEAILSFDRADRDFYKASTEHWVNAKPRTIMTKYMLRLISRADKLER